MCASTAPVVAPQEPVDTYADLYFDAAHVLMDVGQPDKALPFLTCASSLCVGLLGG